MVAGKMAKQIVYASTLVVLRKSGEYRLYFSASKVPFVMTCMTSYGIPVLSKGVTMEMGRYWANRTFLTI